MPINLDSLIYAVPCGEPGDVDALSGRAHICSDRMRIAVTICEVGTDLCNLEGLIIETYFGSESRQCVIHPEYYGGRLDWHSRGVVEGGAAGLVVQHEDSSTEDLFRETEDGPYERSGSYTIQDGDALFAWWVYANWTYTWQEILKARFFLPP